MIKQGHPINWKSLRNLLVTKETKMHHEEYKERSKSIKLLQQMLREANDEHIKESLKAEIKQNKSELKEAMHTMKYKINTEIQEWELNTPKDIRSCAIEELCSAYKSAFTNLKRGNIKFFNMDYRKKNNPKQHLTMTPKNIKIINGKIQILPTLFKEEKYFKTCQKIKEQLRDVSIHHNVILTREHGNYDILIPIDLPTMELNKSIEVVGGCDLGLRVTGTVYSNSKEENIVTEYTCPIEKINKLNKEITILKRLKKRKKALRKREQKKLNLINDFHWRFINDVLKRHDMLFIGDIKSHDIVKEGKNKSINRLFNDMRFHVLKKRFLYKATLLGKIVDFVNEAYTSKTCSSCGQINESLGSSKTFNCHRCGCSIDRDVNASKNILMKGLMQKM